MLKNLSRVLLIFVFLLTAFSAQAITDEAILIRIIALEAELAELRGLLQAPAPATESAPAVVSAPEELPETVAVSCHQSSPWAWDYCTTACPCQAGEGDCDTNKHCLTGYCALDVGAKYGQTQTTDVCEERPVAQQASSVLVNTAQIAPLIFNSDDILTIKGTVIDKASAKPLALAVVLAQQNIFGLPVEQVFGETNAKGVFSIKINKRLDLNKDIFFRTNSHLSPAFYLCADCKGYALALVKDQFFNASVVFPVLANEIDLGDIALQETADIVLFSDRFVSAFVEYQKQENVFTKTAENKEKKQKQVLSDSAPLGFEYRVVLEDRQGNRFISPLFKSETTAGKPISLVFWNNEFSAGACGNNICEKEESICPDDCQAACSDSQEQGQNQCLFGCENNACKSDVRLSFPDQPVELAPNQKIITEWASNGLENEKFDLELLAFNTQGELLADFQHLIATSVPAVFNQYEWVVPDVSSGTSYKAVIYNKMCLGGNETLVSCLTNRYLDKSDNSFTIKKQEAPLPFAQTQIASISQAASALAEKIKQLLGR